MVSFPHIREDFGVFLGVGEVVDFIRVFLQVIEFFGRLGLPEVALSFVEFAFVEEAFQTCVVVVTNMYPTG